MYKFSFKVRHKGCYETALSRKYPLHHITVVDIQSANPREKQYFYYITGDPSRFDAIIKRIRGSKGYKFVQEIERSKDTLLLIVVLDQASYIQNVIQKYHGFFLDLHTVSGGYEYWHIGVVDRNSIDKMLDELKVMGKLHVLYIGEADFGHKLLSPQQEKIFMVAKEQGYYENPRKTTVAKIAKAAGVNSATAGEHLLKAENKMILFASKRLHF